VCKQLEAFYRVAYEEVKFDEDAEEQSLESYGLFQQWEAVMEELLQEFLSLHGLTEEGFWGACQRCQRTADEEGQELVEALECALSTLDYRAWCGMMRRKGEEYDTARQDAQAMGI
jgi:hypothetical protein